MGLWFLAEVCGSHRQLKLNPTVPVLAECVSVIDN